MAVVDESPSSGSVGPLLGAARDALRALGDLDLDVLWPDELTEVVLATQRLRTQLEAAEVQKVARSFMDKIEKVLGPTRDIPAPDVNTNAQVMAWMMDEYGKLHGHTPAICTGKHASGISASMKSGYTSPQTKECMQPMDVPRTTRK